MKKYLSLIISVLIISGLNVWIFLINQKLDSQLAAIAFGLVWLNLIIGIFINSKQKALAYIFLSSGLIIEILMIVNYFWIQRQGRFL